MTGENWRIRWAVSAVDDDGQPMTPYDDDGEPIEMAIGLTERNVPVIAVNGRTAYLAPRVALVASTGLRTVIEQAMRTAGEL